MLNTSNDDITENLPKTRRQNEENLEDRISPLPTSMCGGNKSVHSLIEKKEIIRDKDVKI
jgi:hypothetical protein